jgi:16S rRNA (uracil1498-N3)-methyltransferase
VVPRFFAPGAERSGDITDLPPEEAAHLTRVLRLSTGAAVRVFNGRGSEFEGIVESVRRSEASVLVGSAREPAPEPRVAVTVGQAVLKGDRMDDVVRDAVMMGAFAIQPIVTERSEVTLATLVRGRRQERWNRIAVSAAKQSGRATVPAIMEPRPFDEVVHRLAHLALPGPGLLFVEPSAGDNVLALREISHEPPRETTIVIGPEGGWDPKELEAASAGCRLVTVGRRVLRADAMAVIALAALFSHWGEY